MFCPQVRSSLRLIDVDFANGPFLSPVRTRTANRDIEREDSLHIADNRRYRVLNERKIGVLDLRGRIKVDDWDMQASK